MEAEYTFYFIFYFFNNNMLPIALLRRQLNVFSPSIILKIVLIILETQQTIIRKTQNPISIDKNKIN